jgi:tRNA pseudouridine55 synthase
LIEGGAVAQVESGRLWLVDKPAGMTSHDVVWRLRRRIPDRPRVGHAGTLDPFATGLLVAFSGRATRLVRYLVGLDKRYETRVRLGARSATGDPEGPIEASGLRASAEALPAAIASLTGSIDQQVPGLSAVRVDGERLYKRVRRGEDPERPTRPVMIHSLEILDQHPALEWVELRVHCSTGTYIRQLAIDLGEALGCGGYCETLRRTHVGTMSLANAEPIDAVEARHGRDLLEGVAHLPARHLTRAEAVDVGHGRRLADPSPAGPIALVSDGALLAVGRSDGAGIVKAEVVLQ